MEKGGVAGHDCEVNSRSWVCGLCMSKSKHGGFEISTFDNHHKCVCQEYCVYSGTAMMFELFHPLCFPTLFTEKNFEIEHFNNIGHTLFLK